VRSCGALGRTRENLALGGKHALRTRAARPHDRLHGHDKPGEFTAAEADVREHGRRLWADAHPVAPWEWRKGKREPMAVGKDDPIAGDNDTATRVAPFLSPTTAGITLPRTASTLTCSCATEALRVSSARVTDIDKQNATITSARVIFRPDPFRRIRWHAPRVAMRLNDERQFADVT
jgi:hypothetical protein